MKPASSNTANTRGTEQMNQKNARKSLHVLQPSAVNKENLIGPGRIMSTGVKDNLRNAKEILNTVEENGNKIMTKKVSNKAVQTDKEPVVISEEDLTSTDGPSEKYWEILAERRRVAVDETLKENEVLCKKIEILEEQNEVYKSLLEETQALVETFQEVINDSGNDSILEDELVSSKS